MGEITALLQAWSAGDLEARDRAVELLYQQMRSLARARLSRERPGHLLSTTALVHEAYLNLAKLRHMDWHSRAHFFAAAAVAMRRILVGEARKRQTAKRGGNAVQEPLDATFLIEQQPDLGLLELYTALTELAAFDPQRARVVDLRYILGLSIEETAELLGCSPQTVNRDWTVARAWLARRLRPVRQG